jgi:ABC-type multidrug transport system ATPase subunit
MIEVHELTKRYGCTAAVDGLSFTVQPGRVTGFLGPNGAGKSTTMRVILGLDAPTSGWATVNGRPYRQLPRPLHQAGALLDAEHLIVIGRGRLVADAPVEEFVRQSSRNDVLVRSPAGGAFAGLLEQRGGAVTAETSGGLAVTGLDAAAIGDLARAHGIALHELTPRHPSLEEAFMELTQDSVDYRASRPADTPKAA